MFNDTSSPLALLATRRSGKPRDMIAPGPSPGELRTMLTIAARAPDHGKLSPWRFVVIAERDRFAKLLSDAFRAERPGMEARDLEAVEQFAHQAPTLVAVLSTPVQPSKIPVWEQQLSAGAVCMALVAAASASGYVAGWVTGWAAYSNVVLGALGGGADDRIAGFVFIGSPGRELDERPRPDLDSILTTWGDGAPV